MNKKHHLMIGVFAASVALTSIAEAGVDKDLARGKSPAQAASAAFANGENPVQISRAFSAAGVSRAVAAHSVATAPRASFGNREFDNRGRNDFDRGRSDFDRDRGRGYDLSRAIHGYKDYHDPGRALAKLIALLKLLAGWHGHHPGGPSPC
ncbi:MAG: hypothetical protein SV422_00580 [Pseudomonadota bacterium]|nr:hypothetical protein [Pseudomonadota bacterium]